MHIFLDGRTHTARVRAAVSVAMPGAQRHGRRRYISFPRLPRARGEFTTELAPPLEAESGLGHRMARRATRQIKLRSALRSSEDGEQRQDTVKFFTAR